MSSVLREMGTFQLQFVWVNQAKTHYRYANQQDLLKLQPKVWDPFKEAMGNCQLLCVLTRFTYAPRSRTKSSYRVLGILCGFDSFEDLRSASHAYWGGTKWVEDDVRPQKILEYANLLKEYIKPEMWVERTMILLEACAQGHIIEAQKLSLEFLE